jgi:hypothetical protein
MQMHTSESFLILTEASRKNPLRTGSVVAAMLVERICGREDAAAARADEDGKDGGLPKLHKEPASHC